MILSALLFIAAVICYSIKELKSFSKLRWMHEKKPYDFWGDHSHLRKYKWHDGDPEVRIFAPDNWYYRTIDAKYVEAWFTSTWLTVAFTDGFHMCQALTKIFICSAFYPLTNWWFPVVLWLLWGIVWNLCDKYLTK